jgi:hydroxymethylpyrimidine/phosphomethylpyrimidine kinase
MKPKICLSIAGIDLSGGAGLTSDIRTFSILGVHSLSVVSAITLQNTYEIRGIKKISPSFLKKQLETILDDIIPDSTKISMIPSSSCAFVIYDILKKYKLKNVVLDPVMISKQKVVLTPPSALRFISKKIFPLITLVTPNIPEASFICQKEIKTIEDIKKSLKYINSLGVRYVLLKGGHLEGEMCIDTFYDGKDFYFFKNKRFNTLNTHGTGCVLSSAISAFLAKGYDMYSSVKKSIVLVNCGIKKSFSLGRGYGTLNLFYCKHRRGV